MPDSRKITNLQMIANAFSPPKIKPNETIIAGFKAPI
jgi:hypothetical protein